MKIDWSGRSHKYSRKDIAYFAIVVQHADPLTQGNIFNYLKKILQNT